MPNTASSSSHSSHHSDREARANLENEEPHPPQAPNMPQIPIPPPQNVPPQNPYPAQYPYPHFPYAPNPQFPNPPYQAPPYNPYYPPHNPLPRVPPQPQQDQFHGMTNEQVIDWLRRNLNPMQPPVNDRRENARDEDEAYELQGNASRPRVLSHSPVIVLSRWARNFEVKPHHTSQLPIFEGFSSENCVDFLKEFLAVVSGIYAPDLTDEEKNMIFFPLSLKEKAKTWLLSLEPGSLRTWEEVHNKFLDEYYPNERTWELRANITGFRQRADEEFHEAYARFRGYVRDCPHHCQSDRMLHTYFFDGLLTPYKLQVENGGRRFKELRPNEAKNVFERMYDQSKELSVGRSRRHLVNEIGIREEDPGMEELRKEIEWLKARLNNPGMEIVTEHDVNAVGGYNKNFDPYPNKNNPGWAHNPNLSYGTNNTNYLAPPQAKNMNAPSSPRNPNPSALMVRPPHFETENAKLQALELKINNTSNYVQNMDGRLKGVEVKLTGLENNLTGKLSSMETMMTQFFADYRKNSVDKGKLPSQPEHVMAIRVLRSGREYEMGETSRGNEAHDPSTPPSVPHAYPSVLGVGPPMAQAPTSITDPSSSKNPPLCSQSRSSPSVVLGKPPTPSTDPLASPLGVGPPSPHAPTHTSDPNTLQNPHLSPKCRSIPSVVPGNTPTPTPDQDPGSRPFAPLPVPGVGTPLCPPTPTTDPTPIHAQSKEVQDPTQAMPRHTSQGSSGLHRAEKRYVPGSLRGAIPIQTNPDELCHEARAQVPFPSRLRPPKEDKQFEDMYNLLKDVKVNIPLLELVKTVPAYVKFFKELVARDRKGKTVEKIRALEELYEVDERALPPKQGDPGSFCIAIKLGNGGTARGMLDLGAGINLMPYELYKRLDLGEMSPTGMRLQMADRSIRQPMGVVRNVLVQVDKLFIPADFVVLDIGDSRSEGKDHTILLGRPFMATSRAVIDVQQGKVTLRALDQSATFVLKDLVNTPSPLIDAGFVEDELNNEGTEEVVVDLFGIDWEEEVKPLSDHLECIDCEVGKNEPGIVDEGIETNGDDGLAKLPKEPARGNSTKKGIFIAQRARASREHVP